MSEKPLLPETQGKFRRDLYERVSGVVKQFSTAESPYRAVGEMRPVHRIRTDSVSVAARELRALDR